MSFRKVLFWMHLIAGCVAGVVIFLMSLTGVLLMYERQTLAYVDRGPFRSDPPAGRAAMPIDELLTGVPANATVTVRSDPREPVEIGMGREGALFVNAYTGQKMGKNEGKAARVFQKLRAWHRWLGIEANGPGRNTAKAITGAANLVFLFIVISGAYLWLPKYWSAKYLRPIVWFRGGLSGKARDFNWHNVFGVWALIPLFFVVLCALPISYQWAGTAIYSLTGTTPPPPPPAPAGGPPSGVNRLWDRAKQQQAGWVAISGPAMVRDGRPVEFTIDTGTGGEPQKRSTLALDPATGEVRKWETFADGNSGRRLRAWSRFTHTGEAFGMVGQTLAGLASAAGVMLVWTGLSLALRRFAGWRARR